jgi:ribosomal protein S20
VEQDKSKEIAKEFEQKLLKEIFEDCPSDEDEHFKTIQDNKELKTAIQKILEGIENDDNSGMEAALNQLLESFIEELIGAGSLEDKTASQYKAKLAKRIKSLRIYLLTQGKNKAKLIGASKDDPNSKEQKRMNHARKKLLERFAIYEIYKVMNPRRIAGESGAINFINNMIIGGLKRASKYEGGKPKDLAKYSPSMLKKLNHYHNKFKKNNFKGIQM